MLKNIKQSVRRVAERKANNLNNLNKAMRGEV